MSPGRRSVSRSSSLSTWNGWVRRIRGISERYGFKLETCLVVWVITVGFAVTVFTLIVGFGEHGSNGPSANVVRFLFGSWVFVLLGLAGLGALVVANAVLSLVEVESEAVTVDSNRFWDRPRWYQGWQATKALCGGIVVIFCTLLLLSVLILALERVLSLPEPLVELRSLWSYWSGVGLLWFGSGLVLIVVVHAVGRAVRLAFESL